MKPVALISFLWTKNSAVLDYYLRNKSRVILTLDGYLNQQLQDRIQAQGSSLVVLDSLLNPLEKAGIENNATQSAAQIQQIFLGDSWRQYAASMGFEAQQLNPVLEKDLRSNLAYGIELISALEKARSLYQIELIILNEEWLIAGKYAVWWAKMTGIPCLHLAHSTALTQYYMVHSLFLSNKIAIFGERDAENLYDLGLEKNRLRITGNPAWDVYPFLKENAAAVKNMVYEKYRLNPDLPLILCGSTWDSHGSAKFRKEDNPYVASINLFVATYKKLADSEVRANFLIKDRSANQVYGEQVFDEAIAKLGITRDSLFYAWDDTESLIVSAAVVISIASNLSIEAMIAGTPAIDLSGSSPVFEADSGILSVNHDPAQLANAIRSVLENQELRDRLRVTLRAKADYYSAQVGTAGENVAALMEEMALKGLDEQSYSVWREHQRWPASAVARLALQVVPQIEAGSGVHLLAIAAAGDQPALADTINTLAAQGSSAWRLTVFSPDPCPDPLFETMPALAWMQIGAAEALLPALDQVIAASPMDWFMVCAPGIRLEPPFVSLILAAAARHPDWRCLYFDEERIDDRGQVTDPRLKPDANIELLRSSAYVGHAVLTHRALWPMLNPYLAAMPRAFAFDAVLRSVEFGGEATLGHINELAVALPETADGTPEDWALIAKPLLEGHLQRSGLIANVNEGYLPATFFVDYQLTAIPLISIIIHIKDRLDVLQICIESLLKKTCYSHYELIIIDNNNTDLTTLAYLDHLPARDNRIRVLCYKKNDNCSSINNFAAQEANGDFLLFLGNDNMILQDNWLERMVAIGLHKDVGAVSCRLISTVQKIKHAGMILGLNGVIDFIGIGLPLTESGYMGRTQLTQNFSAISYACMLIRKDLFIEVGGFDEKDFSSFYYDADLCLKLGAHGYRIVWTPFVTLARQDKSDANTERNVREEPNGSFSRKAFIKKWRAYLGNDPAYNRHLSLRRHDWIIDGDFHVPWHPDFESLPRIVAQAPDEMGVGQYRMMGPLKELADNGRICRFQLPPLNSDKRFMPFVSELIRAKPTILFLQNAFSEFHLEDLQNYAELLPDVFRVFGQDDIVFAAPPKSSAKKHFGKDTKARVRRGVSLCHRVIVTTEPIAEAMRGMVDDIRVVPNYLERSRWGNLQRPGNERRKPRVGWAGAQEHQGDLEFILPVVEATANEVDWIFMGLCPPKLRYHVAEVHNAVPFDQYPATLAALDLDLAIAPLEINRFNTAKSNLRLLEYGAVGYPVIATDILPYRNAPITRVPNNPKAWIDAIRAHIHDLNATRAAGEQLREWVLSNWMLDQHLDEWMKALLPD